MIYYFDDRLPINETLNNRLLFAVSNDDINTVRNIMTQHCCKSRNALMVVCGLVYLYKDQVDPDQKDIVSLPKQSGGMFRYVDHYLVLCILQFLSPRYFLDLENGYYNETYDFLFGGTLLMSAARHDCQEIITLLLDAGANVNASNENCETSLMMTSFASNVEAARLLLGRGADVNAIDEDGNSMLHRLIIDYPLCHGELIIIDLLIEHHIDVNTYNGNHDTPLMLAARSFDMDVVEKLVYNNADLNIVNQHNHAAIHCAAMELNLECVQFLIHCGAKIH